MRERTREGRNPKINGDCHYLDMCIDSSKARRELGYEPKIAVREGLEDSLRWMAERGELRIEN